MVDAAIASNNTDEFGNLLAPAAYWNSNPDVRFKLTGVVKKVTSFDGLSSPEKGVNHIAADIYAPINSLTDKHKDIEEIPM